jgi:predicted DNA-binding transcriptional regulator YafY
MSEIDRLYQYKTLLSGRRAMSREDIMQKLEILLATFKRDIAKLRDQLHTPIVFDRDLGGYRLEQSDSTELPGLWFSQDEMLALMTIQSMIVQLEPGLLGPKLKPFQKRLDDMLASQGLDTATLTQRVRAVHAGKRHLILTSFETVAKATLERKQVQIEHLNRQNGERVLRDISPQQLVHYRDNWYVDAWCHLRGGLRSFSIDAIERAQLLSKAAKNIDLISMRQQLDGGYRNGAIITRVKVLNFIDKEHVIDRLAHYSSRSFWPTLLNFHLCNRVGEIFLPRVKYEARKNHVRRTGKSNHGEAVAARDEEADGCIELVCRQFKSSVGLGAHSDLGLMFTGMASYCSITRGPSFFTQAHRRYALTNGSFFPYNVT